MNDVLKHRAVQATAIAPRVAAMALRAINVAEAARAEHAANTANKHLSAEGAKAKTMEAMRPLARRLALSEHGVRRARNEQQGAREALVKNAFEPFTNDVMAGEIRATLRGMTLSERTQALAEPQILAAVAGAPAILHGIPADALGRFLDAHLANHHATDVAKIAEMSEAITVAESSVRVGRDALASVAGITDAAKFDQWLNETAKLDALDLQLEDVGGVSKELPKYTMTESVQLTGDDKLSGQPK